MFEISKEGLGVIELRTSQRTGIDAAVEGMTLVDILRRNAEEHGDSPAIHWKKGSDWTHLTWSEYRQLVMEMAAGLASLGVSRGRVVAIQAGNRPEHVVADLAAIQAGGASVTLYSTLAAGQIEYIAQNCRAVVAVLEGPEYMARWESIRPRLPDLRYVVLMDGADRYSALDWVLSWEELATRGRQALAATPDLEERSGEMTHPDDVATFIYTSGTTGLPKGVGFSHRNLLWTTESARLGLDLPHNLRMVSYLPLAHIAERMATHYLGMWLASEVYYCPELSQVVEYVIEVRPQAFVGVPRVWEKFQTRLLARFADDPRERLIMRAVENGLRVVKARQRGSRALLRSFFHALADRLIFSKVRHGLGMDHLLVAVTTAAPADPELIVFFNALGIPLCELYGLSECSGPATTNRPGANRIGSAGTPFPGVEVGLGADDEVLIRGGNVASGYHLLPAETAETFDAEGWLHTGDLGSIDSEGYLHIVGRKKEILITSAGKNIAPSHLETPVKSHPLIAQACVVGDGRPFLTAIIALDPDEAVDWAKRHQLPFTDLASFSTLPEVVEEIQNLIDGVNQQVARVEQVKKFVIAPQEWTPDTGEVTPSLKVRRSVVLEKYFDEIEAMYTG